MVGLVSIATACAEVMDKEPSLIVLVRYALLGAFFCGLIAYKSPKYLCLPALPILFFWAGLLSETQDRYLGPAILREAGPGYVAFVWSIPLIFALGVVAGIGMRTWLRRLCDSRATKSPVA